MTRRYLTLTPAGLPPCPALHAAALEDDEEDEDDDEDGLGLGDLIEVGSGHATALHATRLPAVVLRDQWLALLLLLLMVFLVDAPCCRLLTRTRSWSHVPSRRPRSRCRWAAGRGEKHKSHEMDETGALATSPSGRRG